MIGSFIRWQVFEHTSKARIYMKNAGREKELKIYISNLIKSYVFLCDCINCVCKWFFYQKENSEKQKTKQLDV